MTKDPRVHLAHILERASRPEGYVRDGHAAFMGDPKTQDAVIRNFEVIGEAASQVRGTRIGFPRGARPLVPTSSVLSWASRLRSAGQDP